MAKDFITIIRELRTGLSKLESEIFENMHKVNTLFVDLSESGGAKPSAVAYNKLGESYEKLIECKLWLGETLERIGHITEESDVYIPEIKE